MLKHMFKYIQIVRQRLDQLVLTMETESQARGKSPTKDLAQRYRQQQQQSLYLSIFFISMYRKCFYSSYNLLIELIYHSTHAKNQYIALGLC